MGLVSHTHPDFWKYYDQLPEKIQKLADKKFKLFRSKPFHPSLGFAQKGKVWTVEIGLHYRAIAWRNENNVVWFWIGSHETYNKLMNRLS